MLRYQSNYGANSDLQKDCGLRGPVSGNTFAWRAQVLPDFGLAAGLQDGGYEGDSA